MEIMISPVGTVRNRYVSISRIDRARAGRSRISLLPEYAEGLYRLEESGYLDIIFYFHRSDGYSLICKTPHWGVRGVFASRSPFRPVPLGLTTVKLLSVEKNEIIVEGLDALDGTPVLDIKPHVDFHGRKKEETSHEENKRPQKRDKGTYSQRRNGEAS
ncbi:MAG: tRNA (N6-threonylcarbamoyladenosine(37)-N6)-methyltransferase TrmO [Candidatus Omnitrophica bacterium]|nr:tRNA (N6-threonylcarbamoyladenosine(37)-N6)-methyltransferase TrmO [Candidatus Omnitrophota bacterium]